MGMRMGYVDTSNLGREAVAGTARRFAGYLRPHARMLALAFVALVAGALLNLVPPLAMKIVVDDFLASRDVDGVLRIVMVLVGVYLARSLFNYVNFYLFARTSQTTLYEIARDMFTRLVRQSMRYFETQRTGDTVSRLTSDVQAVQQALQGQVLTAGLGMLTMVVYLAVMITLDWRLTLIILSVVPAMVLASVVSARMLRRRYRVVQETIANINTAIEENVSGVRVSRAFAREEEDAERFRGENRANLQANLSTTMVESVTTPMIEGLSGLSVAAILLFGGWQITMGEMTPGTLIAFLAYLQIFHQPLTEIVRINYVVQSGLAAADRIFQFMDEPTDIVDAPDVKSLLRSEGRVEYQGVSFSYDGVTPVLTDINLAAEPGQMVALVGHTGSGKTTLMSLLARFYDPTSGRVIVDGRDVRGIPLDDLRNRMAYVPQETFLFSGTIEENIRFGNSAASASAVDEAARVARADDFTRELPDGYATLVGEGGIRISRGEQQRIALARAVLDDPRILVLDEATSDVDAESEWEIQRAMEQVMRGRTTFVIAHRLSTVRRADIILVMQDGRIVQRGTHDQLITSAGHYRDLHGAQFEAPPDESSGPGGTEGS